MPKIKCLNSARPRINEESQVIDGERALSRILRYRAFVRIAVNDRQHTIRLNLNTDPLKGIYPVLIRGARRYDAIVESGFPEPACGFCLITDHPGRNTPALISRFALVQLPQLGISAHEPIFLARSE